MEESDRKLKAAEARKRALEWIEEKWTNPRECPVCGVVDWHISGPAELDVRDPNQPSPQRRRVYPVMVATCKNCAYTRLFNALIMGAEERLSKPDAEPVEGSESEAKTETGAEQ